MSLHSSTAAYRLIPQPCCVRRLAPLIRRASRSPARWRAPCGREGTGEEGDGEEEEGDAEEGERVAGAEAVEEGGEEAGEGEGSGDPQDGAGEHQGGAPAEDQAEDPPAVGAEGDPDGDLAGAAGDGVGDHAIDPDHRQDQRQDGEQADQQDQELAARGLLLEAAGERRLVVGGEPRRGGAQLGAQGGEQGRGRSGEPAPEALAHTSTASRGGRRGGNCSIEK